MSEEPQPLLWRARVEARSILMNRPIGMRAFMATRGDLRPNMVTRDTDLVIEGFPRSANTFALVAFEAAQPGPLRIAHHLHAAPQLVLAARWGVPAIALVREPRPTVVSESIRRYRLGLDHILRKYVRFHKALLPVVDRIVIAPFEQVTTDFGVVIDQVNEAFGTSFARFEHTPDNVERCFAEIDALDLKDHGGTEVDETSVARPIELRADRTARVKERLEDPALEPLLRTAQAIHDRLVAQAPAGA